MSTTDVFSSRGGVDNRSTSDRARAAVKAFRRMQPTLTSYARVLTGKSDVRVEMSATSNGMTDGKRIFLRPPLALGDNTPHDRALCDKRDEHKQQRCTACWNSEAVLVAIYHEIGHIAEGTFDKTTDEHRARLVADALKVVDKKFARAVEMKIEHARAELLNSYMGMASLVSPFLPSIVNCIEDARVNRAVYTARKGTKPMFEADAYHVFTNGVEQKDPKTGETVVIEWRDYPLNSQAAVALYCKVSGFDINGWFVDEVVAAMDDPSMRAMIRTFPNVRTVGNVYELAISMFMRLRELGFFASPTDPASEPEDEEQEDEQDDTGDPGEGDPDEGSGEAEGGDEEEAPAEAGSGDGPEDEAEPDQGTGGAGSTEGEAGDEAESDEEGSGGGGEDAPDEDQHDDGDPSGMEGGSDGAGESSDSSGSDDGDTDAEGEDYGDDASTDGDPQEDQGHGGQGSGSNPGRPEVPDQEGVEGGDPDEAGEPEEGDHGSGTDSGEPSDGDDESEDGGDSDDSGLPGHDDRPEGGSGSDVSPEGDESLEEGDEAGDLGEAPGREAGEADAEATEADDESSESEDSTDERDSADSTDDTSKPEADSEPSDELIDTGADPGEGGVEVKESAFDRLPMGGPEDVEKVVHDFGHPEERPTSVQEAKESAKDMERAVIQGLYFETPSRNVFGVREHRHGSKTGDGWNALFFSQHGYTKKALGIEGDFECDEKTLGPALLKMRVVFAENKRGHNVQHRKSGKVNARVLGKRAPMHDERVFKKRTMPGKRSYFVLIGIDISASTIGRNIVLAKKAALAQAELCARMGIKFAVYAHSGSDHDPDSHSYSNGVDLDIYLIKEPDEPWSAAVQQRLTSIGPDSANLDGHTIEYYRKILDKRSETDRIMLYYTDGKMPAENYDEELEILQREIKICKRNKYKLLGVGIRTDSPARHGLDTVQVDTDEDIIKVVQHLEKVLLVV